jgi:hypothetical protein
LNNQYAEVAVSLVLQGVRGGGARRELKDCHIHIWDGFGAGCGVRDKGMENVRWWPVRTE